MEVWNAYDEHLNLIKDKTLIRGQEIPEGIFHLVCEILVKHLDGTYLVMQRDYSKHNGGMWQATAGGSALFGEEPLDCAIRELREETGVMTSRLTELGRTVCKENRSIYIEYFCSTNWKKNRVVLQKGETMNFKWVTDKELIYMKKNKLLTYSHNIFRFIKKLA